VHCVEQGASQRAARGLRERGDRSAANDSLSSDRPIAVRRMGGLVPLATRGRASWASQRTVNLVAYLADAPAFV